jgi:hypothetical protein
MPGNGVEDSTFMSIEAELNYQGCSIDPTVSQRACDRLFEDYGPPTTATNPQDPQ